MTSRIVACGYNSSSQAFESSTLPGNTIPVRALQKLNAVPVSGATFQQTLAGLSPDAAFFVEAIDSMGNASIKAVGAK